jgi:hypothetical protein
VNLVTSREYVQSELSVAFAGHLADDRMRHTDELLARQEQPIRKLGADLKKEREESKKRDVAIRKYEKFYKEVNARSAEKARQRETQQQLRRGLGSKGYFIWMCYILLLQGEFQGVG